MSNHSTCTYRTTKTVKTSNKRVQIPTKAQKRKAESHPHLLSHRGVLKIIFHHNHPVRAAHTLSFRDVSVETKKELTDLFEMGHNASSARHAHEQQLLYEAEVNNQAILADRAQNPNPQDIYRLYKWRQGSYGNDNGKGLFEKLQQAVDTYNSQNENESGGQALIQWYDAKGQASEASDSDSEGDEIGPPTKKEENNFNSCYSHDPSNMHTNYEKGTSIHTTIQRRIY